MTFDKWLRRRRESLGPIGDLARDALDGPCCKQALACGAAAFKAHVLGMHRPCSGAEKALENAIWEWADEQAEPEMFKRGTFQ